MPFEDVPNWVDEYLDPAAFSGEGRFDPASDLHVDRLAGALHRRFVETDDTTHFQRLMEVAGARLAQLAEEAAQTVGLLLPGTELLDTYWACTFTDLHGSDARQESFFSQASKRLTDEAEAWARDIALSEAAAGSSSSAFEQRVRVAFHRLEQPLRQVLRARELQGASDEQIARMTGINPSAVPSRISAARRRLSQLTTALNDHPADRLAEQEHSAPDHLDEDLAPLDELASCIYDYSRSSLQAIENPNAQHVFQELPAIEVTRSKMAAALEHVDPSVKYLVDRVLQHWDVTDSRPLPDQLAEFALSLGRLLQEIGAPQGVGEFSTATALQELERLDEALSLYQRVFNECSRPRIRIAAGHACMQALIRLERYRDVIDFGLSNQSDLSQDAAYWLNTATAHAWLRDGRAARQALLQMRTAKQDSIVSPEELNYWRDEAGFFMRQLGWSAASTSALVPGG